MGDGPASPRGLTEKIYTDVEPALHGAAARNVFAALLGLVAEGRCEAQGGLSPDAVFALT